MKQKIYLITGLMASGKSTVSDLLAKSIEKCVHLRGDVFRKMIISGRENMSATPSAEAVRQLYLRYKLTADAARSYFDNGFSVVIQDNYYGDELNRMINYLHKYPVEVVVLCPDVETIKEGNDTGRKQAIPALRLKPYTIHLCRQHHGSAFGWTIPTKHHSRQQKPF